MSETMTQTRWNNLSPKQRDEIRDLSALSPQLVGLEGWRIEVVDRFGETRRFIVGRSTGWVPIHIEVPRRDSTGGMAADREYKLVRKLYQVRP